MTSYGGVFEFICVPENMRLAMLRAARGKRDRLSVAAFLANADSELTCLRGDLQDGCYEPRPYTQFRVMDPKPRTISCASFRDRVVHHAMCGVIGPLIERRFITHCYACRVGKGTHKAVVDAQGFSRCFGYFLKLDIYRYFDSVDHEILLGLLRGMFREARLIRLLEVIVCHPLPGQVPGRGLPIGNLTSQWFANLYLDGADHLVKDCWGIKGYLRYMDDAVLWSDSKARLWRALDELRDWLVVERRLKIKERGTVIAPCCEGLTFVGMRIFPGCVRVRRERLRRMRRLVRRREREFAGGVIDGEQLSASARATCGVLGYFGLKGLVQSNTEI